MISSRHAAFLVVAVSLLKTAVPAAHAQSTVGTITQIQGTANIQRAGATIAAATNMPILLHDKISTEANSSLTIGLVDNSSLQLGASSTLTIDNSILVNGVGAPSQVGLLGGHLHSIIVGAMRGSSTTFEVNTPNAIGAVRGTEWDTGYDEDEHEGSHGCRKRTPSTSRTAPWSSAIAPVRQNARTSARASTPRSGAAHSGSGAA